MMVVPMIFILAIFSISILMMKLIMFKSKNTQNGFLASIINTLLNSDDKIKY